MTIKRAVKTRLLLLGALYAAATHAAPPPAPAPDAHQILSVTRIAQTTQHMSLTGQLRNGPKVIPLRMTIDGNTIRYQFANPDQIIQLRLLEKDSRLEEITRTGTEKITPARFDTPVRDSDISYEDLSMKFLYWPTANVVGEESLLMQKCWIIRAEPAAKNESHYSRVMLWIEKESGTLLQAEAFDAAGNLAKRFKVKSGQKINGRWVLKQMRIEAPSSGSKDRTPTYLEIKGEG